MTIKFLAAAIGAACMLGGAGSAAARDGIAGAVSEKVQVEAHNGKVLVRLTIDNDSDRIIYVPRTVAADKELLGAWFEVRDSSNGDPLDYVGRAVKRAAPGKDDYVAVKPHARHHNTVDITQAYAFMPGRHTYQLSYAGNYVADLRQPTQLTSVEPDSVMFAFIGR